MKSIRCFFGFHEKPVLIQQFNALEKRIGCKRCGKNWLVTRFNGFQIPWCGAFERFYVNHGELEIINPDWAKRNNL